MEGREEGIDSRDGREKTTGKSWKPRQGVMESKAKDHGNQRRGLRKAEKLLWKPMNRVKVEKEKIIEAKEEGHRRYRKGCESQWRGSKK